MKSLLRGKRLVTIMLFLFLVGMFLLIYRIQTQASFYISNSESKCFGWSMTATAMCSLTA